nr:hypothetical protein [Tanacetum cinerariifolium]
MESYAQPIPFHALLKKEKEKEQFKKFLENLQQLSINIPFIEELELMPTYAKFMKDLHFKKRRMEETSRITLKEICSTILLNEISLKEKDPRSLTIPCIIGKVGIDKALADLRARISLMPYSMFTRTMDTTIEQQAAMDEAFVPHAQRLRIGRCNFRLLSDIKSKESTLQLVYDVLRICPFFK